MSFFPLKKYIYDCEKYPFRSVVQSIFQFQQSLEAIHTLNTVHTQVTFDNDTKTMFQETFYKSPKYNEFREMYYKFVESEIFKLFPEESALVVQTDPCFRVCVPDNTALGHKPEDVGDVIGLHCDADYNHPPEEHNYILALTEMWESNSVYIESEPGTSEYAPLHLHWNEYATFYGNKCRHHNKKNVTRQSRVSIDFRVIPHSKYNPDYEKESVHGKRKFVAGDYFFIMRRPSV
jgi:hypothetical protein